MWLALAAVNWLVPIAVGLLLALIGYLRIEPVWRDGPQFVWDVHGPFAARIAKWHSGFTFGVTSLLWRGPFDLSIGHERGHVWVFLALGLAGHLVDLLTLPIIRLFVSSWREAYHRTPVELFCRWYGPRWADRRARRRGSPP